MDDLFLNDSTFNSNINFWDTSSVTTMQNTFRGAIIFNQPLDNWNVLNVTDMSYMFDDARLFNQDIGSWTTSNVTDMEACLGMRPFLIKILGIGILQMWRE